MFTKDLNSILSQFTKVQKDLENFVKVKTGMKVQKESEILNLKGDIDVLQIQIKQAEAVKANVDKILGA